MKLCVVFVCNRAYLQQFEKTVKDLRTIGNYNGDITLIIGNDLRDIDIPWLKENNISTVYFPDVVFPKDVWDQIFNINSDGRTKSKTFQWHKLHLFQTYFKKWDYILYLDCGMKIYQDILPIIGQAQKDSLVAHSDSYPIYQWKLHDQFDKTKPCFYFLSNNYNLNTDYFQSTIMLFDTDIIKQDTFIKLVNLACQYPISRTNEQGILAVYFANIWKRISLYDYFKRDDNIPYIMTKS